MKKSARMDWATREWARVKHLFPPHTGPWYLLGDYWNEAQLPLVKLRKGDWDTAKKPAEAWETIQPRPIDDALAWIDEGYGVAVELQKAKELCPSTAPDPAPLCYIDIDAFPSDEVRQKVLVDLHSKGAVILTTRRGAHIVVRDRLTTQKKAWLHTPYGFLQCEVYAPDTRRLLPLPAKGTPRAQLGGRIYGEADPPELPDLLRRLSTAGALPEGYMVAGEARDTRYRDMSDAQIIEDLKNAPKGERHNRLLDAAIELQMRGLLDDYRDQLRQVACELFGRSEGEREYRSIVAWVEKHIGPRSTAASRGLKKVSTEDLVKELGLIGTATMPARPTYLLTADRWAITLAELPAFASVRGVALSEQAAKRLFPALANFLPRQTAFVLPHRIVPFAGRSYLPAPPRDGIPHIYELGCAEGVRYVAAADLGMYVEFAATPIWRSLSPSTDADASALVQVLAKYANLPTEKAKYAAALLAPIMTGLATGVVFITGKSGTGKSTLSHILQYAANGAPLTLTAQGAKATDSFRTLAGRGAIVGIDENRAPEGELQNEVKLFVSHIQSQVRQHYSYSETTAPPAGGSVILTAVSLRGIAPDTAHRGIHLHLSAPPAQRATETQITEALSRMADKLLSTAAYVCRNAPAAPEVLDGWEALLSPHAPADLPPVLARDRKADLARAYWHACKNLGCADAGAIAFWREVRHGALSMGLGVWGDVVRYVLHAPSEVLAELRQGIHYKELAKQALLYADPEAVPSDTELQKLARQLGQKLDEVAGALLELGIQIEDAGRDKRGKKVRIHYMSPDTAPPSEAPNASEATAPKGHIAPEAPKGTDIAPEAPHHGDIGHRKHVAMQALNRAWDILSNKGLLPAFKRGAIDQIAHAFAHKVPPPLLSMPDDTYRDLLSTATEHMEALRGEWEAWVKEAPVPF